ncbi:hypothetical protein E0L36_19670 [Streptomyces sp. AJS327]|uniref:hypothetical protein n=1 Tax=Streptomyces sp. AJS327 TaxID=2545265 RepID=UPI0015DE3D23|nr:hypothetical protein [Streptomyces sp. AJS327]MBA0053010.1 hypothetical protein [Streptomyces sp. AJS327]
MGAHQHGGWHTGVRSARRHALSVLRVRNWALAVTLLPAGVAVVLFAGAAAGHLGSAWAPVRWAVAGLAVLTLAAATALAALIARAEPAVPPTVRLDERAAPELYRLVRELAAWLDVPAPTSIALTPDCDSWLEERPRPKRSRARRAGGVQHPEHRPPAQREAVSGPGRTGSVAAPGAPSGHRPDFREGVAGPAEGADPATGAPLGVPRGGNVAADGPEGAVGTADTPRTAGGERAGEAGRAGRAGQVLVIGSPFLWWMRIGELRALLAPVVAGTDPSAHPDVAAARRFVRGLDAAIAVTGRSGPLAATGGWLCRRMLRASAPYAAEMERGVAMAASARAQRVDDGVRASAQEQVGLAYAGWDRLLTRVALPAWHAGRWPDRLNAGVVAALTELSRRDRLADGLTARLGERPSCDLLEEPGRVDSAVSLLAAHMFLGEPDGGWSPVDWSAYPEEVVDRAWRTEAARLFAALDAVDHDAEDAGGTLARVIAWLAVPEPTPDGPPPASEARAPGEARLPSETRADEARADETRAPGMRGELADTTEELTAGPAELTAGPGGGSGVGVDESGPGGRLAARISAAVAREEAAREDGGQSVPGAVAGEEIWIPGGSARAMGLPLRPPRGTREVLAEHVTAVVCCAVIDTGAAAPGLDWLDGPTLLVGGERVAELARPVLDLVEDGDAAPLRTWLAELGVRADKPVRLL